MPINFITPLNMLKKLYNKPENGHHYIMHDQCQQIWNIKKNKSTQWSHDTSISQLFTL